MPLIHVDVFIPSTLQISLLTFILAHVCRGENPLSLFYIPCVYLLFVHIHYNPKFIQECLTALKSSTGTQISFSHLPVTNFSHFPLSSNFGETAGTPKLAKTTKLLFKGNTTQDISRKYVIAGLLTRKLEQHLVANSLGTLDTNTDDITVNNPPLISISPSILNFFPLFFRPFWSCCFLHQKTPLLSSLPPLCPLLRTPSGFNYSINDYSW